MINQRSEPDATKEIEYCVDSPEHSGHKYWPSLEIEPESNSKPDEHIRKSS